MAYDPKRILRTSAQEYRKIYHDLRIEVQKIDSLYSGWQASQQKEKAINAANDKLDDLLKSCTAARDAITSKAEKRKTPATPEASDMVRRRLANGYDFYDLVEQLVSEGDRAGLSALVKELPDLARAGKLPGDGRGPQDFKRIMQEAEQTIASREAQLYDETEAGIHADAREVAMNFGMLSNNHRKIAQYVERQAATGIRGEPLHEDLFHWQGLPGDNQPKGTFSLNEYATA